MPSLSAAQSLLNAIGLHYDVRLWLGLFALVFARVTAAVTFTPFLGGRSVPARVKVGLGFLLSAAMLPALANGAATLPASGLLYLALLVKEAVVGSTIGFLAQLVFYGVQMAGTIIDTQRGLNQITFLAPQLEGHPSALGALEFQAALVVFFVLQGHLMFIGALMNSFSRVPILTIPQMASGMLPLAEQAARTSADALLLACQMAAPVVLAIFLVDVAFASAGRIASQIRISPESFTAKALVGLGFVCLVSALFFNQLKAAFTEMARNVDKFVQAVR
ncbi:MAG: flagellar biosynthetic protein FliR [Acidobacteriaceae bacterium]|nr:flagellar biosynthetic protein FliR [Acidobacteriaceae bacterium]